MADILNCNISRFGADSTKHTCYNVMKGRYVTITSDSEKGPLKLCDVKLFGEFDYLWQYCFVLC